MPTTPVRSSYSELQAAIALILPPTFDVPEECETYLLSVDDCCREHGWSFVEYSRVFQRKCMDEYAFLYANGECAR